MEGCASTEASASLVGGTSAHYFGRNFAQLRKVLTIQSASDYKTVLRYRNNATKLTGNIKRTFELAARHLLDLESGQARQGNTVGDTAMILAASRRRTSQNTPYATIGGRGGDQ